MGLNPKKCVFGIDSGKFLGLFISPKGIEVDTRKIDVIINIPPPKNISQLHMLQEWIQAIHPFVASLVDWMLPFTHLLKNDMLFGWNENCKQDFESLKEYLATPPSLQLAVQNKLFILCIVASSHALAALLAQQDDHGK